MDVSTVTDERAAFTLFVAEVEPRLRRAFTLLRGFDGGSDATAEALAWGWEHWADLKNMANPAGYLYRVGFSRTRRRRRPVLPIPPPQQPPGFEPALVPALKRLTERQRTAVVLIHGCQWTHEEVAEALGLTKSSVATHQQRALERLRKDLGVDAP